MASRTPSQQWVPFGARVAVIVGLLLTGSSSIWAMIVAAGA